MDWLYLLGAAVENLISDIPEEIKDMAEFFSGADLYRFCSSKSPAIPISLSGVGNYTSYGVRTMAKSKGCLFLGMANPMNLLTDQLFTVFLSQLSDRKLIRHMDFKRSSFKFRTHFLKHAIETRANL